MREIKAGLDQEWKRLATEELDQILQTELEKEHPNEEVVLPVLRILEEREKDYPVEKTPEVLAMLEKLSERKPSFKRSKRRCTWTAGVAALAAVACIIIMAIPRTVGAESIFDVLFRWTSSIFEFVNPDRDESYPNEDTTFYTDNPGLQQLYDKLTELGVTESVVPMWLPEGFELLGLNETPSRDNGCKVNAVFKGNEKVFSITYRISHEITIKVEKEKTAVEEYDYADISHFVLENDENISVTWTLDGIECLINTDIPKNDVYTVIKSIYRRTLK